VLLRELRERGYTGGYANAPVPDLIFLDLSQPRVSGLEVLKVIKSTPALMHIPIMVAAGSDDPKFIRAVYALNGNCFIRKPSELNEFVRFIESCYAFWSRVVTLSPKLQRRAAPACAIGFSSRPNIPGAWKQLAYIRPR
jgi:CheY-like chemotaxis protein